MTVALNYVFFFFFTGWHGGGKVAAFWGTRLCRYSHGGICWDCERFASEEVRYRSQQANSYKTSEHNHRHAKGGRKLAAARWQKEREGMGEKVGATRIERATPRGSRQRAREGERRDERPRKRTQYRFSDSGSFSIPSTIRTVDRKVRVFPPPRFSLSLHSLSFPPPSSSPLYPFLVS